MDLSFRTTVWEVAYSSVSSQSPVPARPELEETMDEGAMDAFSREPSFIGFDNHSEASSTTYSAGESDLLDERDKDHLEELEWLDKDGNEIENVQQTWTIHHIVRTQLGQHIGHGHAPTPVLKRMLEIGSTESIWPEARRWQCEKRRYLTRKGDALGEDNSAWISTHLKNAHSASLEIEESRIRKCPNRFSLPPPFLRPKGGQESDDNPS